MNIIDVTLRDGGHAVDFNWDMSFVKNYYDLMSDLKDVTLIELGYWGQTEKSVNPFYNLNMDTVLEVTQGRKKRNISVMVDYHYCSHDMKCYREIDLNIVRMIRVCSRKQDMEEAIKFCGRLKTEIGIDVSLNVFNITSYDSEELTNVCHKIKEFTYYLDMVYFADTHGKLNLIEGIDYIRNCIRILSVSGIEVGIHLHDHSGKAYSNYCQAKSLGFISTDTSVRGMGKGSGNLKLEHIICEEDLPKLAEFINQNGDLLRMTPSPYELITAVYGVTDIYATHAEKLGLGMEEFANVCSKMEGQNKDVFNKDMLNV